MKLVSIENAIGHIICHDITRIVKNGEKGVAFKKGHVVHKEDIEELLSLGKRSLYIWESNPSTMHENDAAEALYSLCANRDISRSEVKEGKIDLYADTHGVLKLNIEILEEINCLGDMIIATRHNNSPVQKGDKLAGMRVIPLVIERKKIDAAIQIGAKAKKPLFTILPYRKMKIGVVVTGSEIYSGRIRDTFSQVILDKVSKYACEICGHVVVDDSPEMICSAMHSLVDADVIICTGGMSVDPDDLTPLAIRNYGAEVVSYGAPVLPGAMFLLAYKGRQAVVGLPSCAMYAKTTVFDIFLPRILSEDPITNFDVRRLWHGGLCLACSECRFPECAFGKGG